MSCENKLTNLVFKNKENSAKTQFASFSFPFFFKIFFIQNKNTQNEMHECYAMQILKKKENTKPKNKGHKGQSNEAQGLCQKDSIRSSLLHPKPFRCTTSFGICIHIRVISNSMIGIKVESLYQFTNKCYRILCLWHRHFQFVCSFSSLQLVTVWTNVSRLSTKMTNSCRFIMCFVLRQGRLLRLRFFQINPNPPR